jgi:hypothetical protein
MRSVFTQVPAAFAGKGKRIVPWVPTGKGKSVESQRKGKPAFVPAKTGHPAVEVAEIKPPPPKRAAVVVVSPKRGHVPEPAGVPPPKKKARGTVAELVKTAPAATEAPSVKTEVKEFAPVVTESEAKEPAPVVATHEAKEPAPEEIPFPRFLNLTGVVIVPPWRASPGPMPPAPQGVLAPQVPQGGTIIIPLKLDE